ncbi:hypothetical protein CXB51_034138 [Gossypium anomalum]|uniref:Uncharacterized protein n=1 Tax=Gossypium anomalum TaxID=47600 RepID=A0A8J5YAG9_9ROSI|nr:hypothetical protein CXB51_034138 [Gossypium anomalum]
MTPSKASAVDVSYSIVVNGKGAPVQPSRGLQWGLTICDSKQVRGFGFQDLAKFNVALLAKQGWRILSRPDSLVGDGTSISIWNDAWLIGFGSSSIRVTLVQIDLVWVSDLMVPNKLEWNEGLITNLFGASEACRIP